MSFVQGRGLQRQAIRATYDGSAPLEPYQLISQYTLEPLLKSEAEALPTVTIRWSSEYLSHEQDADGVITTVRFNNGEVGAIASSYLIGCDGGTSAVRQALGIKLRGEANLLALRQALHRCDDLYDKLPIGNGPGHGRHYHVANDKADFLIMLTWRRSNQPVSALITLLAVACLWVWRTKPPMCPPNSPGQTTAGLPSASRCCW
jgi:2-polyprenyl-6-methoxyphenol hydroxylase-like FAD-dependent oxidoreductase